MPTCLHCRRTNPNRPGLCSACGKDWLVRSARLPAPMTEPIVPPPEPTPDSKPLPEKPALTVPFDKKSSVATLPNPPRPGFVSDPTPAPATVLELSGVAQNPHARIAPGGTLPAHPGLPGHPMNDAALHAQTVDEVVPREPPLSNPPMTIPATAPADERNAPTPVAPQPRPKLVVLRGLKISSEYPVYEGRNTIGRFADKPVDIDLMNQESVEQIWCSRLHAAVHFEKDVVSVEDLNSLNGTWVNGGRILPGGRRELKPGDVIQIGTVQMKLVMG